MYYDKIKRYRPEFGFLKRIKNSRREFLCNTCKCSIIGSRIRMTGVYEKQFFVLDYHPNCQYSF